MNNTPHPIQCVFQEGLGKHPLDNLQTYLRRHLPPSESERLDAEMDRMRRDIEDNRKTDIGCLPLLAHLGEGHRPTANALVADLRVWLMQRRNRILRDAHAGALTQAQQDALFRNVCLAQHPPLDRDLPKVAAQAIVACSSQTLLMNRLSDALKGIRYKTNASRNDAGDNGSSLLALGRFLAFLRWVPYDWAEEIAIDVLDTIHPPERNGRLRLWVSVLRVFFCRPTVGARSLERLLDGMQDEFGSPPPMELRALLQGILVKGGTRSERILRRYIETHPRTRQASLALNALAMIDKRVVARRLVNEADAMIEALGLEDYLQLLTRTGETGDIAHALLVGLWENGDAKTRCRCLRAIRDLHFTNMTPYLLSKLTPELPRPVRCLMIETIATFGSGNQLRTLVRTLRKDPSGLRFYAIHLVHRRLLDSPMLLLEQESFIVLYDLQAARADLYAVYRPLHAYAEALRAARECLGAEDRLSSALERVRACAEQTTAAPPLLHDVECVRDALRENLFGRIRLRIQPHDLLTPKDLALPRDLEGTELEIRLRRLQNKAERSLAFLQETFLWQEWFLREAPFVLRDDMEQLVEQVRRGEPLVFDTRMITAPDQRRRLRTTFRILCECTRQGIYLTDVLLKHLGRLPDTEWRSVIRDDLTRRRVMIADGTLVYHPDDLLERHLEFTTFAHDYRYGKESLDQPSLLNLWLIYVRASRQVAATLRNGPWPALAPHPEVPRRIGPLVGTMYRQHADEARAVLDLIVALQARCQRKNFELRVIPNLAYGLFCVAPVMHEILQRGIHVSLAGISSQFCDDENISRFSLAEQNIFPLKRYLFSNASNYGTLNRDRVLVVVDGTMEPTDRHDAEKARLPKAYRGYVNHLAAVNYVRAHYGYGMENPERDVASALNLPLRFVHDLVRTHDFRHLLQSLRLCFDPEMLTQTHAAAGTGKTYYSFAQWNPDGLPAWVGSVGHDKHEVPCASPDELLCPTLLFVSMNSLYNKSGVAAYFDNSAEVEHPRMIIGPHGVTMDNGWPEKRRGIAIEAGRVHAGA